MKPQKSLWNEEYYEILEFYYWEPQHLGKSKNPKGSYNSLSKVFHHLKRMEVSLNHVFNTFFSLLPNQETNLLFSKIFGREYQADFRFNSRQTREFVSSLKSVTQPDLFFPSETELVCVEMKVSAKSDFDQFMKYLLLSLIEREKTGKKKKFSLLYLGKKDFSSLFKEKCQSIEELKADFLHYEMGQKTKNRAIDLIPYQNEIYTLSQELDLVYLSYSQFHQLVSEMMKLSKNEALNNIYGGLLAELEGRGLV